MSKIKLTKNSLNFNKDFYTPYMKNMRKEVEAAGLEWAKESKKILESVHEEIKAKLPSPFFKKIEIKNPEFIGYQTSNGLSFYGSVNLIYGPLSDRAIISIETNGTTSIVFLINNNPAKQVIFRARNSETLKKRILKELRDYLK